MSDTQVIIVSGRKQAGKDTACEFMQTKLKEMGHINRRPVSSKIYSFAEPLKRFLIEVMGLTYEQCWGTNEQKDTLTHLRWAGLPFSVIETNRYRNEMQAKDEEFLTGREVMQIFGSNICRMMWPDCWANGTKNAIIKESLSHAFICDARFPNEIDAFANITLPPIIVRLTRNPYNDAAHWSEYALDTYNFKKHPKFILIDNKNMTQEEKNQVLLEKVVPLL